VSEGRRALEKFAGKKKACALRFRFSLFESSCCAFDSRCEMDSELHNKHFKLTIMRDSARASPPENHFATPSQDKRRRNDNSTESNV
jgi:hypothetical protein